MSLLKTGWPTAPLKRVVYLNARTLPETTDPDFEFRYVDIGSVGPGQLIEEPQTLRFEDSPSRARRVLGPRDTIVSTVRTYLRAVLRVPDDVTNLVGSTGFAVLTAQPQLDPGFLSWVVQSDPFIEEVVSRSVGVSYPAISPSDLSRLPVPTPDIATQRAVADFLDAETARIDSLVAKKRRMLDLLYEQFAGRVEQATRARSFAGGRRAKLPDGWRSIALRRCFGLIQYGTGEATKKQGGIPVLGMGNVDRGEIVGDPGGFLENIGGSLLLEPGDLLFNRTNSLALVGKVAMFRGASATTFASYLVRLRTNHLADPSYLNYLLNTEAVLGRARSMALPSIGQANLNPSRYTTMRIPLPPIAEQRVLAKRLDRAAAKRRALSSALVRQMDLLAEHRRTLITAGVTGEIGITGAAA